MEFISQLLEHPALFAFFSGANNYSWLHFQNGERRLLAKPLTYFEERLPGFIRIHKTVLINPACVASIQHPPRTKMAGIVRMQDGTALPVSRRRWAQVVQLLTADPAVAQSTVPSAGNTAGVLPGLSVSKSVLAVMSVDNLLLTQQCLDTLAVGYQLDQAERAAGLAKELLHRPAQDWPTLILLDARTNRPDRLIALREFKSHPLLRPIPIVWLASPADDMMPAYALEANSVVVVNRDASSFVSAIEQLCRYWLLVVRLPPRPVVAPVY